MFKNKFEMGRLMSPDSEGGAGGDGGEGSQGGAEQENKTVSVDPAELIKRLEASEKAKNDILTENKRLKEEKRQREEAEQEKVKKKAEATNDTAKLLEIERLEKKTIADKLLAMETSYNDEQTKILKTKMIAAFEKELGSEFHDAQLAYEKVDWSKFIKDEKSQYGFNQDGIKQAVNEFRQTYPFLLKESNVNLPQNSAKPGEAKKTHLADYFKPIK